MRRYDASSSLVCLPCLNGVVAACSVASEAQQQAAGGAVAKPALPATATVGQPASIVLPAPAAAAAAGAGSVPAVAVGAGSSSSVAAPAPAMTAQPAIAGAAVDSSSSSPAASSSQ